MRNTIARAAWAAGLPARLVLIGIFRAYRALGGGALGGRCRFYPSCSHYAEGAVRTHGAVRGAALALWRILRCNPLASGGVEHVPEPRRQYDAILRGEVS